MVGLLFKRFGKHALHYDWVNQPSTRFGLLG